jgi:hypothetical protein
MIDEVQLQDVNKSEMSVLALKLMSDVQTQQRIGDRT